MNRVVLVGRITKDPELRYTQTDTEVVSFTLAVNRMFTSSTGERDADFVNCVAWRSQAKNMHKYVKKGHLIGVDGRLQTRTYQTETGETRYITEVVCDFVTFLETRGTSQDDDSIESYDPIVEAVSEDDVPF